MFEGIDNAVVIKNIFGDKNVFEKAELINVNWQMIMLDFQEKKLVRK